MTYNVFGGTLNLTLSLPFPSLCLSSKWTLISSYCIWESAVSSPNTWTHANAERLRVWSRPGVIQIHVYLTLPYLTLIRGRTTYAAAANAFWVCSERRERVWCCKCRPISVKRNLKIEENVPGTRFWSWVNKTKLRLMWWNCFRDCVK